MWVCVWERDVLDLSHSPSTPPFRNSFPVGAVALVSARRPAFWGSCLPSPSNSTPHSSSPLPHEFPQWRRACMECKNTFFFAHPLPRLSPPLSHPSRTPQYHTHPHPPHGSLTTISHPLLIIVPQPNQRTLSLLPLPTISSPMHPPNLWHSSFLSTLNQPQLQVCHCVLSGAWATLYRPAHQQSSPESYIKELVERMCGEDGPLPLSVGHCFTSLNRAASPSVDQMVRAEGYHGESTGGLRTP